MQLEHADDARVRKLAVPASNSCCSRARGARAIAALRARRLDRDSNVRRGAGARMHVARLIDDGRAAAAEDAFEKIAIAQNRAGCERACRERRCDASVRAARAIGGRRHARGLGRAPTIVMRGSTSRSSRAQGPSCALVQVRGGSRSVVGGPRAAFAVRLAGSRNVADMVSGRFRSAGDFARCARRQQAARAIPARRVRRARLEIDLGLEAQQPLRLRRREHERLAEEVSRRLCSGGWMCSGGSVVSMTRGRGEERPHRQLQARRLAIQRRSRCARPSRSSS